MLSPQAIEYTLQWEAVAYDGVSTWVVVQRDAYETSRGSRIAVSRDLGTFNLGLSGPILRSAYA